MEATSSIEIDEKTKSDHICVQQLIDDLTELVGPEYYLVERNRSFQMQQYVMAKNSIKSRITNVEKFSENTGFFHVFPNKGGLRISLLVDQTSLAFVSCHLTAHEGVQNCAMRNESVEEILNGVLSNQLFHHVFFMGDMNYRTTFDPATPGDFRTRSNSLVQAPSESASQTKSRSLLSDDQGKEGDGIDPKDVEIQDDEEMEEDDFDPEDSTRESHMNLVYQYIHEQKWDLILEKDELNRELAAGRVLKGFTALPPDFPPTFKRVRQKTISTVHERKAPSLLQETELDKKEYQLSDDPNSGNFVGSYYDKKRIPSYTDRILIQSLPAFKKNLGHEWFRSCEEVSSSDHKPVLARFNLRTTTGLKDIKKYSPVFVAKNVPRYTRATNFQLTNMKGFELAEMDSQLFGGLSDPYIVLSSDPKEILSTSKKLRTKVIPRTINPVWNDTIEFRLVTNDLEGLSRNGHLFLTVWDYDVTNDDDLIGTAVIELDRVFKYFEDKCSLDPIPPLIFNEELLRSGLFQGRLEATLSISGVDEKIPVVTKKDEVHQSLHEALTHRDSDTSGAHVLESADAGCHCTVS